MFPLARARCCALGAPTKRAPRALRFELLEIRNFLSASPNDTFATPQVSQISIIPDINLSVVGYTPAQIAAAYGFNQIKFGNTVGNGAGQTIAIVDAYDDPSIAQNLSVFDKQFGLPDPKLTKVNETGGTKMPIASQSWDLEISLDVEWAHAMAPGANILLVEANASSLTDLLTAVNYARSQPGVSVVSMSWGAGEFSGEQSFDSYFTTPAGHSGETFIASSGDGGAGANWPAVSPNVVAVGGTTLSVTNSGGYLSETAWSGSGGGTSVIYSTPSYQTNAQATGHRTVPDVSFDANPSTGFAVYDTAGGSAGWMQVGGTSAGAPQWAALVAIANQGRALSGQATLSGTDGNLYSLSSADFHDVTSGSNGAYSAKAGYDEVTGRGSPYANLVARDLVNYNFPVTTTLVYGPPVFFLPTSLGGAGGNALEGPGAGQQDTSAILSANLAILPVVVGVTPTVAGSSSLGSSVYIAFVGSQIRPESGSAGVVEEIAVSNEEMIVPESNSPADESTRPATSEPAETPSAREVDAAIEAEQVDVIEAAEPNVEFEVHATPAAALPAVEAFLVDEVFTDAEVVGTADLAADSARECPGTTALAVLAGFAVSGWRPAAAMARRATARRGSNRNQEGNNA